VDVEELNVLIEETLGEELAERLQIPIESSIDPRRGCTSCHVLIDPEVGKYTLAYEAHERVEARRGTDSHPSARWEAGERCSQVEPGLVKVGDDRWVACHI
jgi:hypothetical protein